MQDVGVDVGDMALLTSRTWQWLTTRIVGLLSTDSRLRRALLPPPASAT